MALSPSCPGQVLASFVGWIPWSPEGRHRRQYRGLPGPRYCWPGRLAKRHVFRSMCTHTNVRRQVSACLLNTPVGADRDFEARRENRFVERSNRETTAPTASDARMLLMCRKGVSSPCRVFRPSYVSGQQGKKASPVIPRPLHAKRRQADCPRSNPRTQADEHLD